VLAVGTPRDGVLRGDLVLQGGGDPVLTTEGLAELADRVKATGVRSVSGKLLVDDFRFDAERLGSGWNSDDEPYYYSAQISALSVNRNVLTVTVTPGAEAGTPAVVRVEPVPDYAHVTSTATTGAPGSTSRVDVTRERARNEIRVRGSVPAGGEPASDKVTVEEPELYAGALFRKLLAERGVRIAGEMERRKTTEGAVEVAARESEPLSGIAAKLNKPSDNLVAEMLLKELGYRVKGTGSASAGSDVVEAWLKEIGVATGGVKVNDGSGLSRMDLVTGRAISEMLVHASKQPWKDPFLASLPIGGVDGTLRNRMKGTAAEKNVRAKTGTLLHVTALSGYVATAGGEPLVFSILINGYPGPSTGPTGSKRIEDLIAVALAEHRPAP
jgi:serine-type D-Ala-D-Ala carboxypeptidase/endopeptidase (penicillin-binding protein 4)